MRLFCQFLLLISVLTVYCAEKKEEKDGKKDVGTVIGIDLGTTYSWYV